MNAQPALRWISGLGWLVLSGGNTPGSPLRAQVLARAIADGGVVYLSLADDGGESIQDDMDDLGAPTGYAVDVESEDKSAVAEDIAKASVVVVEAGNSLNALYTALDGLPLDGLLQAYRRGAVLLFEGLAMNLFGRWWLSDEGDLYDGFNWLESSFLEPNAGGAEASRAVQAVLQTEPETISVSIAPGAALALGTSGQLETWGNRLVTISLGSAYQSS